MKHYSQPENKKIIDGETIDTYSNRCVDELHLTFKLEENKIKDIAFQGQGCAVFLSSTDIVINLIKGKTIEEAKEIITSYENMIEQSGEYNKDILGEANVFDNVKTHLNRLDCAQMIARGVRKITG